MLATVTSAVLDERPPMRVFILLTLAVLMPASVASAQWSSFKPVTLDVIPRDQRNIDEQTIVKGKVAPKEIRVDWYGFDLKNGTNEVLNRYQYPVADPTLASGDKITRIRAIDVTDERSITSALRAASDAVSMPIVVERKVDDKIITQRVTLYRANSLILNALLQKQLNAAPPIPNSNKPGVWGQASHLNFKVVAITDDGEGIFSGFIIVPKLDADGRYSGKSTDVRIENTVLRGWAVSGLEVGEQPRFASRPASQPQQKLAEQLVQKAGSSGIPGEKVVGGSGFLRRSRDQAERFVIGIGANETVEVDGKKLKVNVIFNVE